MLISRAAGLRWEPVDKCGLAPPAGQGAPLALHLVSGCTPWPTGAPATREKPAARGRVKQRPIGASPAAPVRPGAPSRPVSSGPSSDDPAAWTTPAPRLRAGAHREPPGTAEPFGARAPSEAGTPVDACSAASQHEPMRLAPPTDPHVGPIENPDVAADEVLQEPVHHLPTLTRPPYLSAWSPLELTRVALRTRPHSSSRYVPRINAHPDLLAGPASAGGAMFFRAALAPGQRSPRGPGSRPGREGRAARAQRCLDAGRETARRGGPGRAERDTRRSRKEGSAPEALTSSPLHAPTLFSAPTTGRPSLTPTTLSRVRLSRYTSRD